MAADFFEMMRDPRWQKRRLEIMGRDKFTCQECGSTEKELHVHHQHYNRRGAMPWEYPDDDLKTLCVDCHKEIGALLRDAKVMLGQLYQWELQAIVEQLKCTLARREPDGVIRISGCLSLYAAINEYAVSSGAANKILDRFERLARLTDPDAFKDVSESEYRCAFETTSSQFYGLCLAAMRDE
jgi:hypothetical protein